MNLNASYSLLHIHLTAKLWLQLYFFFDVFVTCNLRTWLTKMTRKNTNAAVCECSISIFQCYCKSETSLIHHCLQTDFDAAAEPTAGQQGQPQAITTSDPRERREGPQGALRLSSLRRVDDQWFKVTCTYVALTSLLTIFKRTQECSRHSNRRLRRGPISTAQTPRSVRQECSERGPCRGTWESKEGLSL